MSIWQIIIAACYAGGMAYAGINGRAAPLVWAVITGNFIGSMIFGRDPIAIGIVDGLTLALLIGEASQMSLALALCFAVCVGLDAFGLKLGLPSDTTNTIVDWTIIPIAVIIGCLNGGGGNLTRALGHSGFAARYFDSWTDLPQEKGRNAPLYLAANQRVVERSGVNGGQG